MRLVIIDTETGPAAHVQSPNGVCTVRRGDGGVYRDVREVFEAGEAGLDDARRALSGPSWQALEPERLLRPVLEPGAVICVGLNYRSHILEMGREVPTVPTLFSKLPRALTDPYASIELPAYSEQVDYEAELGIVIGRGGRDLRPEDAWAAVGGLTVVNDVTVRDYQRRSPQWFAGKTGEKMTPIGPAVVTPDELEQGIEQLRLRLSVNGEVRQDALLGDLVFGVPELIADISRIVTLRPGDVIATGTPGGVAVGMDTPRWISDSDVVEVSIDGIGSLRNTFRMSSGELAESEAAVTAGRS